MTIAVKGVGGFFGSEKRKDVACNPGEFYAMRDGGFDCLIVAGLPKGEELFSRLERCSLAVVTWPGVGWLKPSHVIHIQEMPDWPFGRDLHETGAF
jgi:hypothetical protein